MMETNVTAMAQQQPFNPWAIPDSFTVYNFAPEEIRSFLHPHWQTQKAPHPMLYYFFGILYMVIGTVATAGNYMVLRILGSFPALRTPANMLVMNLAVSDFLLMISLLPEACYNFFTGGPWQFGDLGCQIHAFCGALCGYSQITTLVLISWDRYNVIVKGFNAAPLTFGKASTMIILSWLYAFGWSVSPLVGWGYYAMDGMLGTCSFDGLTTNMNNKSHILASTMFLYVIPIIIIIGCYYFIVKAVFHHEDELRQQAKKMNVTSLRSNADQQAVSAEIRIAKVAIINVTLWILAWTPFAIVCMLGTWGDTSKITPYICELPVILAKTSCVYNPLIYALSHPKYRECLKELYPWLCIVVETKKSSKHGGDNQSTGSTKTEASSATTAA
ncbi:compound eye opsin BCRH2-like [Daphnia carinata]|uniref:compound eye opsin BCRH2-like n=1 Tax=Daphnia carinata TaxID=120202 RepID=UPI00258004D2|nr:compound eye opsin BCRH2-like [Daphnia carinata]